MSAISGIPEVLRSFAAVAPGAANLPLHRPGHAAIARVWLLGDRYVLRARDLGPATAGEFRREVALLDAVRGAIPWALPCPLPAADGERYVAAGDALWTLSPALPGRVPCPWQELHRAPAALRRRLVRVLRHLHDATRGRLGPGDPLWIVRDVSRRLAGVRDLLPSPAADLAAAALARVAAAAPAFPAADLAFVHGDFHWGNVLVDGRGRVCALLDLDWCRVGHPLEDLGYTAMMLVRGLPDPAARAAALGRIAAAYGVSPADRALLHDYVVLYAVFDVDLFRGAQGLDTRDEWLRRQVAFLADLAVAPRGSG